MDDRTENINAFTASFFFEVSYVEPRRKTK